MRLDPIQIEPDAWCAWCGNALPEPEERHHALRFCCLQCKIEYHRDLLSERRYNERETRICPWCGTEFKAWPRHKHTCNPKCGEALHNWRKAHRAGYRMKRKPWVVTHGGADPDEVAALRRSKG